MGRIHPDAESAYFSARPQLREVVRPFLTGFDVTHAFTKERNRGRINAIYLKPEPFMVELLGVEREVLLVYTAHDEFQARTVTLHDEILAEDRVRLDPLVSVIVSDAPDVAGAVGSYLASEPERPPIIAFSRTDLTSIRDANGLRKALMAQFMRRDLFALESPLKREAFFFGRQEMMTELVDRFRSGQNSGLFGLRRIGKTSVLFAVRRRCEGGSVGHCVFVDCSNPALYRGRWWSALQSIVKALANDMEAAGIVLPPLQAIDGEYSDAGAAGGFKEDVQRLRPLAPHGRILLALDEIEHITFDTSPATHWEDDFLPFWQSLRSLHQDTQGSVCFLIAGVNPSAMEADRVGRFDNPLFSTASAYYLQPFDRSTVRAMVRRIARLMALKCDEALYDGLTKEYGGHPFLIRRACSQLAKAYRERPATMTLGAFESSKPAIAVSLQPNVRQILNVLAVWYPQEFELLGALAAGKVGEFREFALADADFTRHVEGYGLVDNARSEPRIRVGIVQDYLTEVAMSRWPVETKAQDIDGMLAEISRRRNHLELALRRLLKDGLRFNSGKNASATMLAALPEQRRVTLSEFGYGDRWDHLYFDELTSIMMANWEGFASWFGEDKVRIKLYMDHINKSRADAHARKLSPEDWAFLRVCFRRMEEHLGLGQ